MPFFFLKAKEVVPPTPQQTPLTFQITGPGYINWVCAEQDAATIEYKKNDGEWTSITALPLDEQTQQGATIDVVAGDVVQFRGDNDAYAVLNQGIFFKGIFASSTCGFELEGNIMSMINSTDYGNITTMTSDNIGAFVYMFGRCTGLTSAENLVLPVTTLTDGCYNSMFQGCSSLTTAPELPATTLANFCYQNMFEYCSSLTTAPELPATTLSEYCYGSMFEGCSSLNYIKCLATNISASGCTENWVKDVSSTGTFIKNPNMSNWTTGFDGIPTDWTVQDAS